MQRINKITRRISEYKLGIWSISLGALQKRITSAEQQEETIALLKRTDIIVEKLMDENAMPRIERRRLVEESVYVVKQHVEGKKELIAAHRGD